MRYKVTFKYNDSLLNDTHSHNERRIGSGKKELIHIFVFFCWSKRLSHNKNTIFTPLIFFFCCCCLKQIPSTLTCANKDMKNLCCVCSSMWGYLIFNPEVRKLQHKKEIFFSNKYILIFSFLSFFPHMNFRSA